MINIDRLTQTLTCRPGATVEAIAIFQQAMRKQLPADYVELLKTTDGADGFVGEAYVLFWGVGELIPMNQGYKVETYAPGMLLFGTDGGGEAYGFDAREPHWPVVEIPFVGMEWSAARPIGSSFINFLEHLARTE